MKKLLATMLLSSLFMLGAFAQDLKQADVPANIKSALQKKYPETTKAKVSWENEKGNFEANWGGKSGEDNSAMFTPSGNFLEIVKAISTSKLPASVLTYVKVHEHGAKIKEAAFVTDSKGIVTYEAEIKGKELIFDKQGKFLKAE